MDKNQYQIYLWQIFYNKHIESVKQENFKFALISLKNNAKFYKHFHRLKNLRRIETVATLAPRNPQHNEVEEISFHLN